MTWLYFGYLVVYGWLVVDGIRDDIRKSYPVWYVGAGVLGGVSLLALVLAYRYTSLAALFGKGALLLLGIGLAADLLSGYTDLQNEPRPPGMSPGRFGWIKLLGVGAVVAYSVPAYAMAFVVARHAVLSGTA